MNVSTKAAVDALLVFSVPNWADDYFGTWLQFDTLLITATRVSNASDAAFRARTFVSAMTVTVRPSGNLRSFDGTSEPCNATVPLTGSWGDVVCDVLADVYSHTAVQITFSPPSTSMLALSSYTVQYSASSAFLDGETATFTVAPPAAGTSAAVFTVRDLALDVPYFFRVSAALPPLQVNHDDVMSSISASLVPLYTTVVALDDAGRCSCAALRLGRSCGDGVPMAVAPRLPVITAVATSFGSMPTVGGAAVDIAGRYLGLDAAMVSASLSGGFVGDPQHDYVATDCRVVTRGELLRCQSPAGVGGNYTWRVTVDGGVSEPSTDMLSFTVPTVSFVDGPGARSPTRGGVWVRLLGSNFGDSTAVVSASAIVAAPGDTLMSFPATSCRIVSNHTAMNCTMPAGVGSGLTWVVSVEGLVSTVPTSVFEPPAVHNATLAAGAAFASTTGGTALLILGSDFGGMLAVVNVSMDVGSVPTDAMARGVALRSSPSTSLPLSACDMPQPHTALRCTLPPATGRITSVSVRVLNQITEYPTPLLSYAPPTVTLLTPSPLPLGDAASASTCTLSGSGFGIVASTVTLWFEPELSTVSSCGVTSAGGSGDGSSATDDTASAAFDAVAFAPVVVPGVTLQSDGRMTFPCPSFPRIFSRVSLYLAVSGLLTVAPLSLSMAPPELIAVSLDPELERNATHYFLILAGRSLGESVSECADDGGSVVTIDGAPLECSVVTPHVTITCATSIASGSVAVRTLAGVSASVAYAAATLLQSAIVTSVTPSTWNTSVRTNVTIRGVNFGLLQLSSPQSVPMRLYGNTEVSAGDCAGLSSMSCAVVPGGYTTTAVVCIVGPGIGFNFEFQLRGEWRRSGVPVGYAAPIITGVSSRLLPANGGVVTVEGVNFGAYACVGVPSLTSAVFVELTRPSLHWRFDDVAGAFTPTSDGDGAVVTTAWVPCVVQSWSDVAVSCVAPPGVDAAARLLVRTGGQSGSSTPLLSYAAPAVVSVSGGDVVPTVGGRRVNVTVANVPLDGSWPVAVTVGNASCTAVVLRNASSSVSCLVPAGYGVGLPVRVFTPLQASEPLAAVSYGSALAREVQPSGAPTVDGGFRVVITGRNFFPGATTVTFMPVVVSGDAPTAVPCRDVTVDATFTTATCIAPLGVGVQDVVVVVPPSSATVAFAYPSPVVYRVITPVADATQSYTLQVSVRFCPKLSCVVACDWWRRSDVGADFAVVSSLVGGCSFNTGARCEPRRHGSAVPLAADTLSRFVSRRRVPLQCALPVSVASLSLSASLIHSSPIVPRALSRPHDSRCCAAATTVCVQAVTCATT